MKFLAITEKTIRGGTPWTAPDGTVNQLAYAFGGSNPSLTTPVAEPKFVRPGRQRPGLTARLTTTLTTTRVWGPMMGLTQAGVDRPVRGQECTEIPA